jgi:PadR family transcriptional regulator PadR
MGKKLGKEVLRTGRFCDNRASTTNRTPELPFGMSAWTSVTYLCRVAGMVTTPRMTRETLRVLRVLLDRSSGRHYGLEIAKEAGLPTGTIYPILARLEQLGWVVSEWEVVDPASVKRPRRRFYQLSPDGAELAYQKLQEEQRSLTLRSRRLPDLRPGGEAPA